MPYLQLKELHPAHFSFGQDMSKLSSILAADAIY